MNRQHLQFDIHHYLLQFLQNDVLNLR